MHYFVKMKDGTEIMEGDLPWIDLREDVVGLKMILDDGKTVTLPSGMARYVQAKTASGNMMTGDVEVESRYIGFSLGNNTVIVRFDEKTQNISIETS